MAKYGISAPELSLIVDAIVRALRVAMSLGGLEWISEMVELCRLAAAVSLSLAGGLP